MKHKWIDIRKKQPNNGMRVLTSDEYGYVDLLLVEYGWLKDHKKGYGTSIVAWMPLPAWPEDLCRPDADGTGLENDL